MRSFLAVTRAVGWRAVHNTFVNPAVLAPALGFPLIYLAAFAGGLSRLTVVPNFDYRPGYTTFQFAFVLLQAAAFGGVYAGFGIARDFDGGFARRLLLSAPARGGIIAGYAIGAFARWIATAAVVTIAALIVGMRVDGDGLDVFGIFGLGVLINLTSILWACGVATFLRTVQAGALIQMPVFIVVWLAPVYVPLRLLRGWIHAVANVNPATAALDALRGLLAGSSIDVGLAFALVGISVVVAAAWACRGLASAERG